MADSKKILETPLGWEINLMFMLIQAASIVAEDIDMQVKSIFGESSNFVRERKQYMRKYEKAMKDADHWLNMIGADGETFKALNNHAGAYSNSIASAKELVRMCMLHVDRAHMKDGSYRAFKALRSLPSSGIFSDEFIDRFQMKYEVVPYAGDRVLTTNHGEGELLLHVGNKNWNVKLDSGGEIILNENNFKLL